MSDRLTLADRLVGAMAMADKAKEAAEKLGDRASNGPRFELQMAIDEQMNGLASAFMVAYANLDRLRMVALKLGEARPKSKDRDESTRDGGTDDCRKD